MFKFSHRSRRALVGVHSNLVLVVSRGLKYSPHDFAVTEGMRTFARQAALVKAGFSKTLQSKHIEQPDGYAYAIDVMAVGDLDQDGKVDSQDRSMTWDRRIYGEIADAMKCAAEELQINIRWGGDFKSFFDGPHFELT